MVKITTFKEANSVLDYYIANIRQFNDDGHYTLDRMNALMNYLGNPQDTFKTVHVAGTSGKTSTAYYVSALLKSLGLRVGLTVSPHVVEVNERLQINLQPLNETQFTRQLSIFIDLVHKSGIKPSYFELLVAFAYWEFAQRRLDYAVIEVGLGGALDGTNVIHRADKVCVITDIGLDHVNVLGTTLSEIAAQKAGIIQKNNQVFCYQQNDEIMRRIKSRTTSKFATLHVINPETIQTFNSLPLFQQRNLFLAEKVVNYLVSRDQLPIITTLHQKQASQVIIPGRMEKVKFKDKIVLLDGAHNSQKLAALSESIKQKYPEDKIAAIVSFADNRSYRLRSSLQIITALVDHLIITTFDVGQDFHNTAVDPLEIAHICDELSFSDYEIIDNNHRALNKLLTRQETVLLVTGSFYLLSNIRSYLLQKI